MPLRLMPTLPCEDCAPEGDTVKIRFRCPNCPGIAEFPLMDYAPPHGDVSQGVWRYAASLPLTSGITLGEGGTPLLPISSRRLAPSEDCLWVKVEGGNPSGSYKDRGTAVVVSAARELGIDDVVVASTGNAGASLATYAARAKRTCHVVVPSWVDSGKLWQIRIHKAKIEQINGDFAQCEQEILARIEAGMMPGGSDNPFRSEGTKTIVFEMLEQFPHRLPDRIIVPIGTGSLISAIHKGLKEMKLAGAIHRLPHLDGVQLDSVTPVYGQIAPWQPRSIGTSVATGINIAQTLLADKAATAIRETGGHIIQVADPEILAARRDLAEEEGIAGEPTACVTVAAYRKALQQGLIRPKETVIATITGNVLKNPREA